jgi:predicted exporter
VDYSVYLFVQSQRAREAGAGADTRAWTATLWPTIRLGMLTSVCGFASLLPSAFPGLAQLGLYSIAGLVAAALVTRHVLPALMPADLKLARVEPLGRAVASLLCRVRAARAALWILPVAAGCILYGHRGPLWAHDLAVLSPVPAAEQALDGALRADLGAPDVRALLVLTGASREAVLAASERLGAALDPLVASGVLAGYQSPSRYLPSLARQQARRASLPDGATLRARLHAALVALPVPAARLEPFVADVEAARTRALIEPAELAGTSLAAGLEALLIERGNEWTALMPLQAARALTVPTLGASPAVDPQAAAVDVDRVTRAVAAVATPAVAATVVDLERESNALYAGYLDAALRLSTLGLAAIIALLLIALRSPGRVARVLAPLGLAVLTVLSLLALTGQPLTLLHLIGLLLIVAVGSNYALFFDQQDAAADRDARHRLLASLAIANLSTVIGFGVLALSGVPVLAALGSTVAPGAFLALVFSAALARR